MFRFKIKFVKSSDLRASLSFVFRFEFSRFVRIQFGNFTVKSSDMKRSVQAVFTVYI